MFTRIAYPAAARDAVRETDQLWRAVCALPEGTLKQFGYTPDQKLSGVGFEMKDGTSSYDQKLLMHLKQDAMVDLLERAECVGDNGVFLRFIESALRIPDAIAPVVEQFATELENGFQLSGFAKQVMDAQGNWMVRFLKYPSKPAGEMLAAQHADKGGFTLHLSESGPGVEYLDTDGEWKELPLSGLETAIIPGLQLQHRARCQLLATCHRVRSMPETADQGRYAAVCFVDFRHTRFYNKKGIGPTQDHPPGFNYGMPWEEFDRKYFIT